MDIKDLNKVQLILLALLLSFVTSLATGITTVTLMQQAPPSVTLPINRIVRQTVEKIVPIEGEKTVETIVVKEEDIIVEAISANQASLFRITKDITDSEGREAEGSAGQGFAVTDTMIVADKVMAPGEGNYYVTNASGKFKAEFVAANDQGFAFLKIREAANGSDKLSTKVPVFGDVSQMKRGQKIIVLGDTTSSFIYEGGSNIKIPVTQTNAGGLVINLDGAALGIALLDEQHSFVSMESISAALKALP